jgi:hypothetical protein
VEPTYEKGRTLLGRIRFKVLTAACAVLVLGAGATAAVAAVRSSHAAKPAPAANGFAQAIRKAEKSQLGSAVAAGWLTQKQAAAIQSSVDKLLQNPIVTALPAGGLGALGSGLGGALKAAETYLGLSDTQIAGGLLGGRSLADLATAQGKTASGLVQAVVTAERSQLSDAVKAGQITAAQKTSIVASLQKSLANLVHAKLPTGGLGALAGLGA